MKKISIPAAGTLSKKKLKKMYKKSFLVAIVAVVLVSLQCRAQYQVGDYYVNGDVNGFVFHVDNDAGELYLVQADMHSSRIGEVPLGSYTSWSELQYIDDWAENHADGNWVRPNIRMCRLIHANYQVLIEACNNRGYRMPRSFLYAGRVRSDGPQRLIPSYCLNCDEDDAADYESEVSLLRMGDRAVQPLYVGIVNFITGELKKIY